MNAQLIDGGNGYSSMTLMFNNYLSLDPSPSGPVAQWIRHRPTEPGIAGSSPAGVILLFHIVNSDDDHDDYDDDDVKGKWNLRAMGMTMLDVHVHVTIVGDSLGCVCSAATACCMLC